MKGTRRVTSPPVSSSPIDEHCAAIKAWEDNFLRTRTRAQKVSDWITARAGGAAGLLFHGVWFALWVAINVGVIPGVPTFDPFPFEFLTMIVSLEAIFLALLVLASQNRLAHQADMRAHLDLQIDLLAEREMTAVLQMLQGIAAHLQVPVSLTEAEMREFVTPTDLDALTSRMEALTQDETSPASQSSAAGPSQP